MKKRYFTFLCLLCAAFRLPAALYSADLTIPELELISRGTWQNDTLLLQTRGRSEIQVSGGYKFGGSLLLGFESQDLTYANQEAPVRSDYGSEVDFANALTTYLDNQTTLQFQGARITYRNLFETPTDLTYFVGRNDRLGSADVFPSVFGSIPIATKYQGYLYFPQNEYRGIHTVNGTGIELSSTFGTEWNRSSLYLYQDGYLGEGTYSADARFLANFEKLKMELFGGATFPQADYGLYRAGVLFYYRPAEKGEFFSQIGIPYFAPMDTLNINDFYFLFEPRVHFEHVSVILTLFWHPSMYLMQSTGDEGSADVHFNLMFGNPLENPISGGLETNFTLETAASSSQDFEIKVTPYLSAITSGVIWNFMINVRALPYSFDEEMFEGVIGVKAEF
ncbi:MAG: hypothetical protein ACOC2R_02420 [Spirochaetota bacterium]